MHAASSMFTLVSFNGGQGRNRTADTKQAILTRQFNAFQAISARFGHLGMRPAKSNSNRMATGRTEDVRPEPAK